MDTETAARITAESAAEFAGRVYGTLSKRAAATVARELGWQGDDARTGKSVLCDWIAERVSASERVTFLAMHGTPQPAETPGDVLAELVDATPAPTVAPQPRKPAAPAAKHGDTPMPRSEVAAAIAALFEQMIGRPSIDADAVRDIVRQELRDVRPTVVQINDAPAVKIEKHVHPLFEKALRLARAGINVMLVGPAGCGKSYLAEQLAEAMACSYGTLHCSAGASESQVTGWLLPTGKGGEFEFVPSLFATLYAQGNSLFLIDEIDAADPNMLTVLNGALANGTLHIPQCAKQPAWKRGANVCILAAANTYGTGADAQYVGRNQLDAATLDRFYVLQMEYDAGLEAQIAGLEYSAPKAWQAAPDATAQELQSLARWVLNLRSICQSREIRRIVSTRTLQKAIAARRAGIPTAEVKADLLAGWSADERSKAGV